MMEGLSVCFAKSIAESVGPHADITGIVPNFPF